MTDAFSELVMPIFQRVIELQGSLSWSESPGLESVKKQTRVGIESAEQRAATDSRLATEFDMSKYGLVAWIDEVLTDSTWGQSVGWGSQDHVLEWDLYGTNLRADRFYPNAEAAESAASAARASTDPLETYLLCVALGFRGAIGYDEEHFHDWVQRVYAKVSETNPLASRPFPEEPADASSLGLAPRRGPALLLTVSLLFAVTALTTLAGYLLAVHIENTPAL